MPVNPRKSKTSKKDAYRKDLNLITPLKMLLVQDKHENVKNDIPPGTRTQSLKIDDC